jgi:hypothetical protein
MNEIDQQYLLTQALREGDNPRLVEIMDGIVLDTYAVPDDLNAQAAQMAGGMEPPGAEPMTLGELGLGVADTVAGLAKGAIQGSVGVAGDIESLIYGFREMIRRDAGQGALEAFLEGLESGTIFPTTEEVKGWLDKNIGPLVPEGASERRREAAKTPEFVGELGGAGKAVVGGTKAIVRAAKKSKKAIAGAVAAGAGAIPAAKREQK